MNKFKKILFLFILFFVSGCTTTYELEIDGNKFKEKITAYIYVGDREIDRINSGEDGERIDALISRDKYPFFEKYDTIYKKNVTKKDNYEKVELYYDYKDTEYNGSNALQLCFESSRLKKNKKSYELELKGYFYCLYSNENVDIVVTSKNKVLSNNADEIKGNKYIWHITTDNFNDVSIKIKVSDKNSIGVVLPFLITFSFAFLVIMWIVYILNRKRNINKF